MPRKRRVLEDLTFDERMKLKAYRARKHTPEAQAKENAVRVAIRREFPPSSTTGSTSAQMVNESTWRTQMEALRREREQKGLSLTDVSERSGIDRATISRLETGKVPNPTVNTIFRYARAIGKRIEWSFVEDESASR